MNGKSYLIPLFNFYLAKVRRSKKISRQEKSGLKVVSKKTVVGRDIIKVEGSKVVNITTGGRRSRENEKRDRRRDNGKQNGLYDCPHCFSRFMRRSSLSIHDHTSVLFVPSINVEYKNSRISFIPLLTHW